MAEITAPGLTTTGFGAVAGGIFFAAFEGVAEEGLLLEEEEDFPPEEEDDGLFRIRLSIRDPFRQTTES